MQDFITLDILFVGIRKTAFSKCFLIGLRSKTLFLRILDLKIIKKIKNCFASHKEIDSDVFEDSRSMLIIGSSNTSKTALLINHLRNTKNRSKKALVIFPAYHSQEIKELNVLENIEVVTHSEDYYFTNRAEIINAVKHGIEDGRNFR